MIDRNARARLGARIRSDKRLTPTTRLIANAALFAATDARNGRCQAYRARLAHEAGCDVRTVSRATHALEKMGYVKIVATWGQRRRQQGGRWFRPRGANVFEWILPAGFLRDNLPPVPRPQIKNPAACPLPDGLARVLERFGNAIADRSGLPGLERQAV
ncbi:MAG: hypothetical protein WCJ64_02125 [Rhodospirillaceae bacterium]